MSNTPSVAFSHVGIFVSDMDTMVNFYTRFLGMVVTDREVEGAGEIAFLTRDSREHHQLVMVTGRAVDSVSTVQQLSFRVDSLDSLREMHAKLKTEPVVDLGPVTHGNAISAYFRDPEGNRVELFVDTPWYVAQPLRIPVDLSLEAEEIWQHVEKLVRSRPGFRSREQWQEETAKKLSAARGRS